ncbi:hypothetical protein K2173_021444 [Erythroxylum novogranatense]|uniref:Glycosyltransferase n=1 Tax=Erythroxylum novogranatense TaxID=1862640 RepID=A0AAV8TUU6_9ROSI|nr:hypothetical protein K2173_021444 [Erythroxylum novogranatense]
MENAGSKPHLVLLSSPGLGHLIPVLELGKRLVTLFSFDVTVFVVASHSSPSETRVLQSAMTPKLVEVVELPPVDISGLIGPGTAVVAQLCVMMREIRPIFRSAIYALKIRPSAVIVDFFGSESLVIAKELGIPMFVYFPCNAWFVALTTYVPILDKVVQGQYIDQTEPFLIPGCRPIRPEDVVDPMIDRSDQQYLEYVHMGVEIPKCDGILVNIWEDLQSTTIGAFRDSDLLGQVVKVPVFTVGPFTRTIESPSTRLQIYNWLDKQPKVSVVYVSFGSGGTLSLDQMTELAWALERSQQRFIWVVRPPTIKGRDGSFFTMGNGGDDMSIYLPEGFLTRTKEVGLVMPHWSPQSDILSHPSVGAFLSHSGWNSVLESITNGVPMIVWPLYAEQRLNATLLVEELGIAIRSKTLPSREVIGREEIENLIRTILVDEEGAKIRNRVKELKLSGEKALSKGGSSRNALSQVAQQCQTSWERLKAKA